MLRRRVPAGLLLSSVVAISPAILAQTAPTKTGAPTTTAKPAPAAGTAAPTATTTGKPADPKAADAKPADASATTPAPSGDSDKEALRLIDDGKKAYKAGQFDKAREQFAASYKVKPDHNTLFWLTNAEAKSNRPRDAAEHAELYLREAKTAPAEDRQTIQKIFDEVTAKLGTWHIKVSVDGADVYLDGKLVGKSPLPAPLFVEPNSHEVEVKKEGFLNEKEILVVAPNTESESEVVLKPGPAEVKPKEPEKKERPIPVAPEPPKPAWWTYGLIGGGGLTVLGLGLGIGLTVSASGKGDEADAQLASLVSATPSTHGVCGGTNPFTPNEGGCAKLSDTLSSQDARANGAIAGFVIAGVGAVGTAGLFFLPKTPFGRKLMGMKIAPVIGFDRMGGTLTGSF